MKMGKHHFIFFKLFNSSFFSKRGNIVVCTAGRFEDLCQRKGDKVNLASHLKSLVRQKNTVSN
jgi:hypothetical protein